MCANLQFDIETPPTIAQRMMVFLPRLAFGVVFIVIGFSKFDSSSEWVKVFQTLGLGQWFRYFTGAMQMTGGALMLVPRTSIAGALMIACTMAGAAVADLFFLNGGPIFIVPLALFGGAIALAWQRWNETSSQS